MENKVYFRKTEFGKYFVKHVLSCILFFLLNVTLNYWMTKLYEEKNIQLKSKVQKPVTTGRAINKATCQEVQ